MRVLEDKFRMFGSSVAVHYKSLWLCMDVYVFDTIVQYRWGLGPGSSRMTKYTLASTPTATAREWMSSPFRKK